jgi:dihydroorotase
MSGAICLKGGRILDPQEKRDEVGDLWIESGKIVDAPTVGDVETVDCQGYWICPGLIDTQTLLCEPGMTARETIATGTAAAAAGGFTSVVAMPGNKPPVDDVNRIFWLQQRVRETAHVRVHLTGCVSKGQEGANLAPMGSMARSGIVAVTDDPHCLQDSELMRRALEYSTMFQIPVLDRCRDLSLSPGGVMNEGYWSVVLGLRGWPAMAEETMVERNILLAGNANAHIHCMSISTAGSVRLVREAKQQGIRITASTTPHHLLLTDELLQSFDTKYKVEPPLRTPDDIAALRAGLREGIIDILASDHNPHRAYQKEVEFDDAPCGVSSLETAVGVYLTHLVHSGVMEPLEWLETVTVHPARVFGLDEGSLSAGKTADVTVIDPERRWVVDPEKFYSKSQCTPFEGEELRGRAILTFAKGRQVWHIDSGILANGE